MKEEKKTEEQNVIVTPKTINVYSEFAVTLKRIHIRLIAEGYTIRDGKFIPPDLYLEKTKPADYKRKRKKRSPKFPKVR